LIPENSGAWRQQNPEGGCAGNRSDE